MLNQASNLGKFELKFFDELKFDPTQQELISGLIGQGTLVDIAGPPGGGKTALCAYLCTSIARGSECFGRPTLKGGTLIFALEGIAVTKKRCLAIRKNMELENTNVPFAISGESLNFSNTKSDVDRAIEIIRAAEIKLGTTIKFVVFDTLSRLISGGDENSAKDMSAFNCVL